MVTGFGPIDSVLSASFRQRFAVEGAVLPRARAPIVALSVTTHQDPRYRSSTYRCPGSLTTRRRASCSAPVYFVLLDSANDSDLIVDEFRRIASKSRPKES